MQTRDEQVWTTGLNVNDKTRIIAFQLVSAVMLQNKLHVFVACFAVPLTN